MPISNIQLRSEVGSGCRSASPLHSKKDSWGLPVFLLSPLMIGSLLLSWNRLSHEAFLRTVSVVPFAGLALSLFCFFLGRISYPRVHNLKVFLLCNLTGLIGLFYYLPALTGMEKRVPEGVILSLLQMNLFMALLLPSYTKYRVTRLVTCILAFVELSLMAYAMFPDTLSPSILSVGMQQGSGAWIMVWWPLLLLVLSFLIMKREFKLGGVMTGCAYFHAVGFLVLMGRIPLPLIIPSLLTGGLAYFILGVMAHWFTRMEHRVSYDPLLQIYNRNFCSRIIEEQTRLNTMPPFGVAMVDIDHFKRVNDTWGHQAGDRVLIAVAQAIQREVVPEGVLCRYGGEELAVFFPRMSTTDIVPIMEKVRTAVQSLKIQNGKRKSISVTVSCGVSHRNSLSQPIVDIIHSADRALYRAKESGRNRVEKSRSGPKHR